MFKWINDLFKDLPKDNGCTEKDNTIKELEIELSNKIDIINDKSANELDLENIISELQKELLQEEERNMMLEARIKEFAQTGTIALHLIKDASYELKWLNKDEFVANSFQVEEFMQKNGLRYMKLNQDLLNALQMIHDHFGKAVTITSGYRSPAYSVSVGGKENDQHTVGRAADIKVAGVKASTVQKYVRENHKELGIWGLGSATSFTHVDVRTDHSHLAKWSY